jgi:hypothetical protein
MLPYDPMLSFIVVVGVFVYYALKGIGKKNGSKDFGSIEEIYRDINEQKRYQNWLYNHRPKDEDE